MASKRGFAFTKHKKERFIKTMQRDPAMRCKLLSALTVCAFFAVPGAVLADNGIVATSGKGTTVSYNNNVATVTTTNVVGKNSVNQFDNFNVKNNEIYFLPELYFIAKWLCTTKARKSYTR